ncbi:MAG TPA: DUF3574 domain-containing protein [Planctomycetota bacterium]|nr:DUF3574 domain-containing protein [Planctomycetota bacterium]
MNVPRTSVSLLLSAILLISAGCHRTPAVASAPALSTTCVKTELFFGLAKPKGKMISESEWQEFLDQKITAVFPQGLTVLDGYGQSASRSGALIRERSKIVIAVHASSHDIDAQIQKLVDEYKARFKQESVLWLSTPVQAKF